MKIVTKLASLIAITSTALTNHSHSEDNHFYIGGTILMEFGGDSTYTSFDGDNQLDIYDDIGSGYTIQFGYDFGDFRTELDVGQRRTDIDKIKLVENDSADFSRLLEEDGYTHNSSFTLNAFYDLELNDRWELYAGAGVGLTKSKGKIQGTLADDSVDIRYSGSHETSYQILAGVTYRATDKIDLTLGYRRSWIKDVRGPEGKLKLSTPESLEIGLRYRF